jgi:hypothetical protein
MAETLSERVGAIIEGGGGESAGDMKFLPLITLESESRCGVDASLRWVCAPTDGRPASRCDPGNEHMLYEVLETKRDNFESKLADSAKALGLPPEEIVLAFPAIAVVRAVLEKELPYLTRLALQWILPSELRELRADIVKVTTARDIPSPIKEMAKRLVVPE